MAMLLKFQSKVRAAEPVSVAGKSGAVDAPGSDEEDLTASTSWMAHELKDESTDYSKGTAYLPAVVVRYALGLT